MKRIMCWWPLRLLVLFGASLSSLSQVVKAANIEISGHVVNSKGLPVGDAVVDIIDLRGSFDHPIPAVQTMDDGSFTAIVQSVGDYRLLAWKQSAGVPDPFFSIYESPDVIYQVITISNNDPVRNVTLKLPNSFGQLIGRVVDLRSGKEIQTGRITLKRADNEGVYLSKRIGKEGRFSILLPPRPIDVLIAAPGYKSWSLSSRTASAMPVLLLSGQTKEIVVSLQAEK